MNRNSIYQLTPPWEFDQPLCAEIGTNMYYADPKEEHDAARSGYDVAKRLCLECVHQADCLEWAVRYEKHGLWGGVSEAKRRDIRRERGIILNEDLNLDRSA